MTTPRLTKRIPSLLCIFTLVTISAAENFTGIAFENKKLTCQGIAIEKVFIAGASSGGAAMMDMFDAEDIQKIEMITSAGSGEIMKISYDGNKLMIIPLAKISALKINGNTLALFL